MLDNLLGNAQEHQEKLAKALAAIELQAEAGDGAVRMTGSATGEIKNVIVSPELIASGDSDQIEDLVLTVANRMIQLMKQAEARESQNMIKDLLPPGMAGLFGG